MKPNAHFLAVFGAASQVLVPISYLAVRLRLHFALSRVGLDEVGSVEQVKSSLHTTTSLMAGAFDLMIWAFGLAMLALGIFIIAITRLRYRRKWAFWFSLVSGVCLICLFPLGTPVGIFLLVYAVIKHKEFLSPNERPLMPIA